MTEKVDQVVGLVTISLAGITATLSPSDAAEWGRTIMSLAPLGLIGFLIWRVRQMDSQLNKCRDAHQRVSEQLLLAFTAIHKVQPSPDLPTPEEFIQGKFNLGDCLSKILKE